MDTQSQNITQQRLLAAALLQLEQAGAASWPLKDESLLKFATKPAPSLASIKHPTATPSQLSVPTGNMCQGCVQVKQEVEAMKRNFEKNIQALVYHVKMTTGSELPISNNLLDFNVTARTHGNTRECAAAVHPLPTCTMPIPFLPWNPWLLPSVNAANTSTILPPSICERSPVDVTKRWSSPSSMDSGQKTDTSAGELSNVDPTGVESTESSSVSSSASTRRMESSPEIIPHGLASPWDALGSLNPLAFQQHLMHQLVVNGQNAQQQQSLSGHNLSRLGRPASEQIQKSGEETLIKNQFTNDLEQASGLSNVSSTQSLLQVRDQRDQQQPPRTPSQQHCSKQDMQNSLFQSSMNLLAAQNTSLKNEGPMHRQMNDLQNQQICSVIQQQQVRRLQGTSIEKKKPVSDDYVKIIRQKGVTNNNINVKVPVPLAYICDPDFKPCSEEQIIHQFRQNRRCDDDVRKAMTFLSKMLAEKRVFGTKLMAQTTVAGPNHSIYKNLPEEGIYYIAHVCRKVMQHRIPNEDEFWEVFRDVTRKLAARCRRVRHSKKVRADDKSNGTIQTNKREEVALDISPDSLATESDDVIKTSDFTVEREKIDKYEEI